MTDIDRAAPRRRLPVVTGTLVLIALAILISLGTWQVQRLHWKEGLLADIAARQVAAPVPLADIEAMAASGGDIEYRKVTATGRYINNKERHFFATWRGQTGFYVYTPLELADGRFLFVNRGFVPYENKEPEMRMQGQLTDQQTVTGLARAKLPGKPSSLVPDNDVAKNIFYWKDLDVMAESVGLEKGRVIPFFVDADSTPNPAGLPIGGVTQVDLPNDHLQYAFTWYGLAAVLVVVVAISWSRKSGKQPAQ
ncbi:surfeit locus 1 family protein [Rhizobium phaseoli]|uniref:SURF1-like protein n=1 Tax=Rhizobium phaseoli TaxID=396 RepID=A0A192T689_9HYPH|nr:SURF1 family protein [Rhizobium phaseoli]MDH6650290.1 surfeit locus 1 family protein [Rhizobium esperanzae]ANL26863.1 surfeit locus 1 family protein [Rhizobium phaseoli]ANL39460.1 surfeit locus 1 family protein [Rhizobium phaseoli]ANL52193.1 surfeit locus 1 family protein [Rhizobium phaseoli]ANL58449.1 surfeit locus 1 family protein [Rhizobium phaseoli]